MSWIKTVAEEDAQGDVAQCYDATRKKFGHVTNVVKILSLQPNAMVQGIGLFSTLMRLTSGLTSLQKLLIATIVSKMNGCLYCMESYEQFLREELQDDKKLLAVQEDYRKVEFDRPTTALLAFASKLTLSPQEMTKDDIESLRENNFDDETILHATQLISCFNYTNRVFSSLGIEPEPGMKYGDSGNK